MENGFNRRPWAGGYLETGAQVVAAEQSEIRELLELAISDDVQQVGLDAILEGCEFFRVGNLGLALKIRGAELWIQAAGGADRENLTRLGLEAVERIAQQAGMDSVGFQTRRPGLVRKARALGYEIDGFILRKKT